MPDPTVPTPEPSTHTPEDRNVDWREFSLLSPSGHARLWITAIVGLTVDLWSKHWAFSDLQGNQVIIPQLLQFRCSLNPGALFGFGHGMASLFIAASVLALLFVLYLFTYTPRERWSMHIGLGMILAGALGNLYDRAFVEADAVWGPSTVGWRSWVGDEVYVTGKLVREDQERWYFADWPKGTGRERPIWKHKKRYIRPSPVVRDFIKIDTAWLPRGYQLWKWIFNVADALLVTGVALLLVNFWRDRKHQRAAQADDASDGQEAAQ